MDLDHAGRHFAGSDQGDGPGVLTAGSIPALATWAALHRCRSRTAVFLCPRFSLGASGAISGLVAQGASVSPGGRLRGEPRLTASVRRKPPYLGLITRPSDQLRHLVNLLL
jgi:hypothetical protein